MARESGPPFQSLPEELSQRGYALVYDDLEPLETAVGPFHRQRLDEAWSHSRLIGNYISGLIRDLADQVLIDALHKACATVLRKIDGLYDLAADVSDVEVALACESLANSLRFLVPPDEILACFREISETDMTHLLEAREAAHHLAQQVERLARPEAE